MSEPPKAVVDALQRVIPKDFESGGANGLVPVLFIREDGVADSVLIPVLHHKVKGHTIIQTLPYTVTVEDGTMVTNFEQLADWVNIVDPNKLGDDSE